MAVCIERHINASNFFLKPSEIICSNCLFSDAVDAQESPAWVWECSCVRMDVTFERKLTLGSGWKDIYLGKVAVVSSQVDLLICIWTRSWVRYNFNRRTSVSLLASVKLDSPTFMTHNEILPLHLHPYRLCLFSSFYVATDSLVVARHPYQLF